MPKPSQPKKQVSFIAPKEAVKPIASQVINIVQGNQSLSLTGTRTENISKKFSELLPLNTTGTALTAEEQLKALKYIVDYHPYGKKASSIYKSFVCNKIEFNEGMNEVDEQDWLNFYASIAPQNSGNKSEKDLLFYIVKSILVQGGVAFWVNTDIEGNMKINNIPFHTITPAFDNATGKWNFNSKLINTSSLVTKGVDVKYASDLDQFMIFFFDIDNETMTPVPFFSSALNDCYAESMWRALIFKVVEKLSILKFFQYQVGKEDTEKEIKDLLNEIQTIDGVDDNTKNTVIKQITDQLTSGSKGVVAFETSDPSTNYTLLNQANAVTDQNVTILTHSTLESPAHISILGTEIRKPLASGLRVPSQFLDLSLSSTETQIDAEIEIFLESVNEMRDFISKILKDLAVLRGYIQGFTLTNDFSVHISESDSVSGLKKSKALTEEQQAIGMKLDNLLKLKGLGYDVTPEMIEEIGYKKEFVQQSQQSQEAPKPITQ